MADKDSNINNKDVNLETNDRKTIKPVNDSELIDQNLTSEAKWINNRGEEVKQVFGFNENAELVNARVAMIGFLMLILTELAFSGEPATQTIFGIK